jgi:DNA invertase Pin-like site-specific DNA recombinase
MSPEERGKISRQALLAAKARGVKIGRPVHEKRGLMVSLRKKGYSFREIARQMKCSTATIQRAIKEA